MLANKFKNQAHCVENSQSLILLKTKHDSNLQLVSVYYTNHFIFVRLSLRYNIEIICERTTGDNVPQQ